MIVTTDAFIESIKEGEKFSTSQSTSMSQITMVIGTPVGKLNVRGYRIDNNGKITYSDIFKESGLEQVMGDLKEGDKISIRIINFTDSKFEYVKDNKHKRRN